jgi:hypothetical protein
MENFWLSKTGHRGERNEKVDTKGVPIIGSPLREFCGESRFLGQLR